MEDSRRRSLLKGISWRITGTIDTLILSYLFTGSIKIAMAIGTTEVVTKIVLFYFHERFWNKLPWGKIPLKAEEATF
ncbi:MAG: hypothetical protein DRQ88_09845 [Epsilonproteobacteria bacterium]|nr:MAG: hypothetical protein DRQ89_02555 [Campylobacterota bacterium]RLA65141.1 MAG: hypothetical protein DRQ88_09845 [Campylobacterota bacterium]